MLKIVVLSGGSSDEREVSLRSGQAVVKALNEAGYDARSLDPAAPDFKTDQVQAYDAVFIALHGLGGEDGSIQKELERLNIAYTGSDSGSSALCFVKYRYWQLLESHHIKQPATEVVNFESFQSSGLSKSGYVLKPNDGGSSIDTFIVNDPSGVSQTAIQEAFGRHHQMLMQSFIEGLEITVPVLEDQALPVIEILPPANATFDYENKYNGATAEICPPRNISKETQAAAQALAMQIHKLADCRDMSRTDVIVNDKGDIFVLETNTIPGLTEQSLLPKSAAVAGYDMPKLCGMLVEAAYSRKSIA